MFDPGGQHRGPRNSQYGEGAGIAGMVTIVVADLPDVTLSYVVEL